LSGGIGFVLSPGAWAARSTGNQLAAKLNNSENKQPSLAIVIPPGINESGHREKSAHDEQVPF
jgi:hypothetical protein